MRKKQRRRFGSGSGRRKGRGLAACFAGLLAAWSVGVSLGVGGTALAAENAGAAETAETAETTEIQLFIAASLNTAMTDLIRLYREEHPEVKITANADSSGTLLAQIEEGYACDIFFSAAQKQMDRLEQDGLVVPGTRADAVKNQVVVITWKGSGTHVTGLANLGDAESIALAGGSVPVGQYTRTALTRLGILEEGQEPERITTAQVAEALDGVEISEQANVSRVLLAVAEGSCEVGTAYYSDVYGYEDEVEILETVDEELTGAVVYPVCRVKNEEADALQTEAADSFYQYLLSEEAGDVFERYCLRTQ